MMALFKNVIIVICREKCARKEGMFVAKKGKNKLELRYYEIPQGEPLLALIGDGWKRNYGKGIDYNHFHNLMEIGYCHYGSGELVLQDSSYKFKGDMFSVIPKNYPHNTISQGNSISFWEYLFIDVEGFLQYKFKDKPLMYKKLVSRINKRAIFMESIKDPSAAKLILAIINEMRNKKEFYKEAVDGLLFSFLLEVARLNPAEEMDKFHESFSCTRIQDALDFINLNYERNIKIKELSEICHMSETHFRRVFEEIINMTPLDYINLVRIQKACDLIKRTDLSMEDIAVKVGFSVQSTFNRNFKALVGCTPYKWKNLVDNYEGKLVNYKVSVRKGW